MPFQSITAGGYVQRADSKVKWTWNLMYWEFILYNPLLYQSLRAVFDKYASLTVDGQTFMTDEDFVIKYLVRIIIDMFIVLISLDSVRQIL